MAFTHRNHASVYDLADPLRESRLLAGNWPWHRPLDWNCISAARAASCCEPTCPDREPNEEERERKTQIMQRVTEAYEKNDLLGLLRLQLEFDRIDQNHIENMAESHLKNYNKLLREQAEELSYELENMVSQVAQMSGKPDYIVSNIHRLRLSLEQDIKEFKSEAASIKKDVKAFGSQLVLKEFLKSFKIPKAEKDIDFFEGMF